MNNLKKIVALVLAGVLLLSAVSCSKEEKKLDLNKFPMVYADANGLEMLADGEEKPTLLTKNFYTVYNNENKVQVATNGKIYYLSSADKKSILGDLYEYDIEKKESALLHKSVYNFKVNPNGTSLVINDGTGAIFLYDKKSEKKNDYSFIQSARVSSILSISADGKYVLYTQALQGESTQTLTIARTDFKADDTSAKKTNTELLKNKDITKGPVLLAKNFKEFKGASNDLSAIYFTSTGAKKDESVLSACMNYKDISVLSKEETQTYYVDNSGNLLYSVARTNAKKISDIITDKKATSDKKITKKNSSEKVYKAKVSRDNIRKKIQAYLDNITTTTFYKMSKGSEKPVVFSEISGQLIQKGVDSDSFLAFFGTTMYNFASAKKPDISKVTVAYKLFDDIKSRAFISVGNGGVTEFDAGKGAEYNSADCFVDTQNNKLSIIMDFDYLKNKCGTLYTATYNEKGFDNITKISSKASAVAHFNSADNYYAIADGSLVKGNDKTVVLKNYSYTNASALVPVVFTSVSTGKKDKYGLDITEDTAYVISSKGAEKLGEVFGDKPIVAKGNSFAYFTSFDYESNSGSAKLFNGSKIIDLGKNVSIIYDFSK